MSALKRCAIIILVPVMLTGCFASKSFVTFEVLEPALITYPPLVRKTGYLNRAPVVRNKYSNVNTIATDSRNVSIIDTIVSNNIRKGFHEATQLTEIGYMDEILFLEARKNDTIGQAEVFDFDEREQLLDFYSLDALIALEYYHLQLTRSYSYYDFFSGEYLQEFRLIMETLWRLYVNDSIAPYDEYRGIDTLYYYNRSSMPSEEYISVTSVIREGSADVGFRYGIKHIPLWTEVSRVVFRGGERELLEAAEYTDRGEWEKAAEIWKVMTENTSERISARAFHNLAIFYELQDDIPTASNYADRAYALWKNRYIQNYKKQLKQRLAEQEVVLKQIR